METLDSAKQADLFEKALAAGDKKDRKLNVYVQVNTSGEEAKSGIAPITASEQGASSDTSTLLGLAKYIIDNCPHLNLKGLMTIGAIQSSYKAKDGEENPDFVCLRQCRDMLAEALQLEQPLELSMGMSNDFSAAIKSGSDSVR